MTSEIEIKKAGTDYYEVKVPAIGSKKTTVYLSKADIIKLYDSIGGNQNE